MDTIFALSSGAPPAAIAIIRISGPLAFDAARRIAGPLPAPRRATLRELRGADGMPLDRALLLVFPAPASVTGEDLVELHLHGGRAVVRSVSAELATMDGLRSAKPGEFTRRALLHGRIDLTEAEGLADLLTAETEHQRRAALLLSEGGLRRRVEDWTDRTLALAAILEAVIDHGDEGAMDESTLVARFRKDAVELADEMARIVAQPRVERLHDGIRVVLAGPPNSGKSSLLNILSQRDAAITSPVRGTTRDRIDVSVQRNGTAWLLTDTAGLHSDTTDPIERIGMQRASDAMAVADFILWLGDDDPPTSAARTLELHSRCDEPGRHTGHADRIRVSAVTGEGVETLWDELERAASDLLPVAGQLALNERHHRILAGATHRIQSASQAHDVLFAAEEVQGALRSFDELTGRAGTEAMLNHLFGRFCIGK